MDTGDHEPPWTSSSEIVTVRCRPCAQQLGRSSPTLAVVEFSPEKVVWRPKRVSAKRRDMKRVDGDNPLAERAWWVSVATTDRQTIRTPKGVELACPRCPHRPRKRQRDLFELAERALAEGRTEIYV
jgi:hypothetical protein